MYINPPARFGHVLGEVLVRKATEADVGDVVALLEEWYPNEAQEEKRAEVVRAAISDEHHELLVAELDGEIVGFLLLAIVYDLLEGAPVGYVQDLYVRADCRSRGLGTALLEKAVEDARARGAVELHVGVHPENELAIRFYEGRGFTGRYLLLERVIS